MTEGIDDFLSKYSKKLRELIFKLLIKCYINYFFVFRFVSIDFLKKSVSYDKVLSEFLKETVPANFDTRKQRTNNRELIKKAYFSSLPVLSRYI